MKEIGRLREVTFRATGEGTGKPRDLDEYDEAYEHLLLWDKKKQEIAGAYRLGRVDVIRQVRGPEGLYTQSLFKLWPDLFDEMGNALELGRSFVRQEYQRDYAPRFRRFIYGWTVGMAADDLICAPAILTYDWGKTDEEIGQLTIVAGYAATSDAASDQSVAFPKLDFGSYPKLVLSSIIKPILEPHVILIRRIGYGQFQIFHRRVYAQAQRIPFY